MFQVRSVLIQSCEVGMSDWSFQKLWLVSFVFTNSILQWPSIHSWFKDLLVGLDLTGVNPTQIPIKFKNCGKVSFSFINFDRYVLIMKDLFPSEFLSLTFYVDTNWIRVHMIPGMYIIGYDYLNFSIGEGPKT